MKSKQRRFITAGVLIALVVVAIAVWMLARDEPLGKSSMVPSSSPVLPSYPPPNASKIASVLNGSDKKAQAELLPEAFQAADWSASDVVPNGRVLVIDQASFGSNGSVGWLIGQYKTPSGVVESETIIHLAHHGERWLITTFEGK